MRNLNLIIWSVYFLFIGLMFVLNWHAGILNFQGDYATGKILVGIIWLGFLAYSLYCSRKENFFKAVGKINRFHWGRQIGIDLYIGVALFLTLIYLHSGSWLVLLVWFIPVVFMANLVTLVYLLIFYDEIVQAIAQAVG